MILKPRLGQVEKLTMHTAAESVGIPPLHVNFLIYHHVHLYTCTQSDDNVHYRGSVLRTSD